MSDKAQELANEVKWAAESLVEKVVAFEDASRKKNAAQLDFSRALETLRKHATVVNESGGVNDG